MSNFDDYEPLGEEWKKEMMKWNKPQLIDFLAKNLREKNQLKGAVKLYIEQASFETMNAMKTLAYK